jgi:DNA repair exonuclease SbcCD nuclease subunit
MKNVSAILCSDLHIRENQPECRTDDFMATQARKHKWLKDLQEEYDVPILCGGDLFNHWKPSPFLLAWAFRNLPNDIISIPGQHDLPAHNMDNIDRSGIQVLSDSGKIVLLTEPYGYNTGGFDVNGYSWGFPLTECKTKVYEAPQVALIHYGVYLEKPHYPGAENTGGTAKSVINKMPGFDLIVSGDNHITFIYKHHNQLLVNPGSFMRTTASQSEHKPSVFLWDATSNTVEQVFVPIEQGVINREHIDAVTERDERLESFVSRLDHNIELGISYNTNMRNHLAKNRRSIRPNVSNIIWRSFES